MSAARSCAGRRASGGGACCELPRGTHRRALAVRLFATLRRLEREHPDKPASATAPRAPRNSLRSRRTPTRVSRLHPRSGGRRATDKLRVASRFLGMFGPQGALPLSTTEEAYHGCATTMTPSRVSSISCSRGFCTVLPRLVGRAPDRAERPAGRGPLPRLCRLVIGLGAALVREPRLGHDFVKLEYCGAARRRG